ncbi:hypothetical protein ILUMI_19113, partial [Ignelater luminosus]
MNGPSKFDRSEEVRGTEGTENLNMMKLLADMIKAMENNRISAERMVLEVIKTKNDTEKFHIMPDLLKALKIMMDRFEKTFCMEASLTDKWNRMVKRIQRSGESLSIYFRDKYGLCKALNLNFPETKEQILVGLTNKYIVQGLLAKNHEDADQLLHDIVEFTRVNENVMRTTRKETTEKKIDEEKGVPSKAEKTCYKCGEKGHYKSECKNKEVE